MLIRVKYTGDTAIACSLCMLEPSRGNTIQRHFEAVQLEMEPLSNI